MAIARARSLSAALAAGLALAGCLSNTHRIPGSELRRLASLPPAERGGQVRVIQGFAGEEPPSAPAVHAHSVVVVDATPVHTGPGPRGPYHHTRADVGKVQADKAESWILAAVAVGIGLAVTEGARYDGWVRLHPMHPVHLYGPHGEYGWVPLAQLDPETAAHATRAYVREGEGPWQRLGRAPLDRAGLTYAVLLGGGELPPRAGSAPNGFVSHVQLGGWPTQRVGLVLDVLAGWTQLADGAVLYDTRTGLELQLMPLAAGPLHLGLFGQAGLASRYQDGVQGRDADQFLAGGALLQLELTTRLALTARAGLARVYETDAADLTVGLAIY